MKFVYYDTVYTLYTQVSTYSANNNLAIQLLCLDEEDFLDEKKKGKVGKWTRTILTHPRDVEDAALLLFIVTAILSNAFPSLPLRELI